MVNYLEMVDYKLFSADSHVSEPPTFGWSASERNTGTGRRGSSPG